MNPNYLEMYEFVKQCLCEHDIEATSIRKFPFRKRSEHIWRVFTWVKRLVEMENLPSSFNSDAVLTAALFHDMGYALNSDPELSHADKSVILFEKYAKTIEFSAEQQDFISFLIQNHSNKALMYLQDTPAELIILLEADVLDETGALSIVWDCLDQGSVTEPSYMNAFMHIQNNSGKMLENNPMVTRKAREIWYKKQILVKEFIDELAVDLDFSLQSK